MAVIPMNNHYSRQYAGFRVQMANTEVELELYGEIVPEQPRSWWTDEPIEGNWIIQGDVLRELDSAVKAGAKSIRLRINSLGGDAGVAITIHNRLRELSSEKGIKVRCIIDGIAASGGSLITCACDEVKVFSSSLFMVHKCWGYLFGGYNADELRAEARTRDAWDQAQINIYRDKCGLSETVISHMMSDTTYLTGQEIVEKGFADKLTEGKTAKIAASADRHSLFVNGVRMHMAPGMLVPDGIPTISSLESRKYMPGNLLTKDDNLLFLSGDDGIEMIVAADGNETPDVGEPDENTVSTGESPEDIENIVPAETGEEGGTQTMARNLEELRTENPELAAQVEADVRAGLPADSDVNAAVEAERRRLMEIDEISALYGDEAVQAAKYGDHPLTAAQLAFEQAKAAATQGTAFAAAMQEDAKKANAVPAAASKADDDGEVDVEAAAKADYKAYLERKEGKK